ncbi:MAG: hypothetical protein JNM59_09530 [Hyphomonadaceae bacterium]|nr:hypothetical protein [Hyphomonadaceae bacterium]
MIRKALVAAAAVLALSACNQQGSGPQLPPVQAGAQAPSTQPSQTAPAQQANVTPEVRQQLIDNIGQQLNQIGQNFASGMNPPTGFTDQIVPMQPSTDHRFNIALTGGSNYTIIGACDGDCTNVDIELIDVSTGGVVASDMLPDDYPVVNFAPSANGNYIVRLLMQQCSVAPCYAGARVLQQTGGGAGPK